MSEQHETGFLPALAMDEKELMRVLGNSIYPGAADDSIRMVIGYCKAAGLDPMQKPVHIVPMWDKKSRSMRDVIMPGIGLYRTQAARAGTYAGVSDPEFGPDVEESLGGVRMVYPMWCRVVVKRLLPNGTIAEFPAVERWKENYATADKDTAAPNAMWKRRPYGQLSKCAEAQALRKAFPEFGAQPTAEEMEGKSIEDGATVIDGSTGEILNHSNAPKELPAYTADQMESNLPAWQDAINAGKTTPDKIMTKISSRYRLSPEQVARISALKKEEADEGVADFLSEMEAEEQGGSDDHA